MYKSWLFYLAVQLELGLKLMKLICMHDDEQLHNERFPDGFSCVQFRCLFHFTPVVVAIENCSTLYNLWNMLENRVKINFVQLSDREEALLGHRTKCHKRSNVIKHCQFNYREGATWITTTTKTQTRVQLRSDKWEVEFFFQFRKTYAWPIISNFSWVDRVNISSTCLKIAATRKPVRVAFGRLSMKLSIHNFSSFLSRSLLQKKK